MSKETLKPPLPPIDGRTEAVAERLFGLKWALRKDSTESIHKEMADRTGMDPRRIPAPSHRSAIRGRPSGRRHRQRLQGPYACRIPGVNRSCRH